MGYILPIQHDTYRNYQYRTYKADRSPYEIKGVRIVKFMHINEDEDFYQQNKQESQKRIIRHSKVKNKNVTTYKITPYEEQELSGKGHYVNVKV